MSLRHSSSIFGLIVGFFAFISPAQAQQTCPPPPTPVVDITSNRFYSDKNHSIVDPAKWEQRKAAMKPLEDFRSDVTRFASRGLGGDAKWTACYSRWLVHWAKGGALLGTMNEMQADFERKWAIAAFSMSYLMVKAQVSLEERAIIEPWLEAVAQAITKDYRGRKSNPNNHYYWLGLALGASATATGNANHWAMAEETFRIGMTHIAADGNLPKETARGLMALHYHNFSLQPLVMLAELAKLRGQDWYGMNDGAIHRLTAITLAGYRDPKPMGKLAGADQKPLTRNLLGWVPFYAARFPDRLAMNDILADRDIWFSMTGGNMTLLARHWIK